MVRGSRRQYTFSKLTALVEAMRSVDQVWLKMPLDAAMAATECERHDLRERREAALGAWCELVRETHGGALLVWNPMQNPTVAHS